MQVVPWNVPILSHPMVHAAECHEVTIIQTQVKSFFQRLDVVLVGPVDMEADDAETLSDLVKGSG